MSEKVLTSDPLEEKIKQLKPEDLKKALQVFREKLNQEYAAYLNSCVHCGLCADSCHYYLTHKDVQSLPAYKLSLANGIFKKYFSFIGKNIPSMGLNIHYLIRTARSALAAIDIVPPGLQSTVDTALEKGNNMGIAKEDWIETVEWLEEELQEEARDKQAVLPMDKKGARLFYTVNPREPMFFPLSILAVGKIFYAAGESWTFSSDNYDVTNYGYYSGDDEAAAHMSDRLVQSMKKLDCKTLVLAECGHGLNANRWEAPEWLSKKYDFEVKSILEIVADYIRQGSIKLDPSLNPNPVTLHDPCNLVRLGGIVEEQRFILKNAVSHFIEMFPNKEKNFCCGGGGGQLAMTRFSQRRLKAGQIKADQIRKTGAKIVAAPCHNCIDQLTELNKHYKLGVEAKTICEIAADALIISRN